MDQEHDGEIDRRHRRIEHRQQYRPGEERAEVLQVGQRLEFAAGSALRGFGGGAQHRTAQFGFGLDRHPHQDEAAHHVHQHMRPDRDDHDDGQHHQRIRAAAGQHAIGHVEQIDRYGQHQQIDHDREDPDGHQVAAGARKPLAEHVAEFIVAGALVQRRRTAATTTSAASTAGGTSTVPVASDVQAGAPDLSARSRRWIPAAGLCFLPHRRLDGRRLRYSGCRRRSLLVRECGGWLLRARRRCIKPWTKRNDLGRIRRRIAGILSGANSRPCPTDHSRPTTSARLRYLK